MVQLRINNRTVIFIKKGADPEEARQKYLAKHDL